MNPIFQALVGGHSATQILSFISQAFPKFKPQINKAQKMGYPAEKIVEFLSDTMQSDANSQYETSNRITARKRAENKELTKDILKTGAAAGATALGYQFLQRIAPGIAKQFMNQGQRPGATSQGGVPSPSSPQSPIPPSAPTPQGQNPAMGAGAQQTQASPIPPNPINPSPAPQIGQQVAQQAQAPIMQAKQTQQGLPQVSFNPTAPSQTAAQPQQPDLGALLEQSGLKDKIDALRERNPPEVISKILASQSGAQVKELEAAAQAPFDKIVSDYMAGAPPVESIQEKIGKGNPVKGEPGYKEANRKEDKGSPFKGLIEEGRKKYDEHMNAKEVPEPTEYMPKKEKGSTVALPTGEIGEITDIRQGIATVNAQGKEYRRKIEDLIEPPLPGNDLADLYRDLISGIENKTGQDVSRMVSWAGYDPKTNELAFVPHTGALYIYDNISPEDSAQLTNILTQRKSTGENFIGAWNAGTDSPIGAGMSQLIQKLQKERGGKGNEYKGKYEKIYDAIEPAKLAAKQKHAEQKKAEKGQLIKEKKEPTKPTPPKPELKEEPKPEPKKAEINKEPEKEKVTLSKALKMKKEKPSISKEFYENQLREWNKTIDKLEESNKIKYTTEPKKELKRPEIEPSQLKKQKSFILDAIDKAIKNPTNKERVEINVPGDGNFKINNDKDTLEKFFKRVDSKWPTGPMPSGEPKPHMRQPLKKAQKESEEVSEKIPKPVFKQFEFKNNEGETEEHEGKVYDDVLGLVKTKSGFKLTHIPTGVLFNQFKTEKSAREFIKLMYDEKLMGKGFKKAKDMDQLRETFGDVEKMQTLIRKYRGT